MSCSFSGDTGAIVLSGGRASRLGHTRKGSVTVAGRALLTRVLDAIDGIPTVVVGDDSVPSGVTRVREDPPFSGPAAAIAAGIEYVDTEYTLVLAVDLPFLADALDRLFRTEFENDGAVAADPSGRWQYLLSRVSCDSLRAALGRRSSWADQPVWRLFAHLSLTPVTIDSGAALDIDTWDDVQTARKR